MSEFTINDHILDRECLSLAQEIVDEFRDQLAEDETLEDYRDEMDDRAHEYADGHQWVIYNHKALMLCAHCSTDQGEEFADECFTWEPGDSTIYSVACTIAYGEMLGRIRACIDETI